MKISSTTVLIIFLLLLSTVWLGAAAVFSSDRVMFEEWQEHFRNPPPDCWPQTYWCWPGNAVTKREITWQLEQMHQHHIGGVLLNSAMPPVYEQGNLAYLSDEYLAMVRHTAKTAARLGMKLNINFGEHWVFGGYWVPPNERSQSLVPATIELRGPRLFDEALPRFHKAADRRSEIIAAAIPDEEKLVAVVAAKLPEDGADGTHSMDASTLVELTSRVAGRHLTWQVPAGKWRVMAFWLRYTGQGSASPQWPTPHWCIDHFSKEAVTRYCRFLAARIQQAVGDHFGTTVEGFHCDSFELANLPNGIYFSDKLMDLFRTRQGYDLAKYLPAIWWDIGALTPRIRYDVNELLHQVGLENFFVPFLACCQEHGVRGSMECIGFPTDVIQSAGLAHLPMMEVTPGEKGAVPWFDTRIGPKKYISSGAHLYGRNEVAVEAYTYIHWELYRATLEELKIATDGFLRSGANRFYNHFYSYSPERQPAPSRAIPFAARISHTNIWWEHYPLLARYVARCCYLLRQGHCSPDIALYSPLANQWTHSVLNARAWTRDFDWGDLGKLLIANGYDFDLVNDDALVKLARIEQGTIKIRDMEYRILVLPNIESLPLGTMEFLRRYVAAGGVVIALERLPSHSVGLADYQQRDRRIQAIVREMFQPATSPGATSPKEYGSGKTYFLKEIIRRHEIYDPPSPEVAQNPLVKTLRCHLPPDFWFDYERQGLAENDGLCFVHRKLHDTDLYFVANIRNSASHCPVTFRVRDKVPYRWNPLNGAVTRVFHYRLGPHGTEIPVHFHPYQSMFYVFVPGSEAATVPQTNFHDILDVTDKEIVALAGENGAYHMAVRNGRGTETNWQQVTDIPAPLVVAGPWELTFPASAGSGLKKTVAALQSWTDDPATEHFSGTGQYVTGFSLPAAYVADGVKLCLDVGRVGSIAEIKLNDMAVGTHWIRGQVLDITRSARRGDNSLAILVTNTLINRVAGFQAPPPVPADLVPHYGSGTTPFSASFRGPIGFRPLPTCGLLGPVRIIPQKVVRIPLE